MGPKAKAVQMQDISSQDLSHFSEKFLHEDLEKALCSLHNDQNLMNVACTSSFLWRVS